MQVPILFVKWLDGCWFYRPEETYHLATKKFYEKVRRINFLETALTLCTISSHTPSLPLLSPSLHPLSPLPPSPLTLTPSPPPSLPLLLPSLHPLPLPLPPPHRRCSRVTSTAWRSSLMCKEGAMSCLSETTQSTNPR